MNTHYHGLNRLFRVNARTGAWAAEPCAVVENTWQFDYGYIVALALTPGSALPGLNMAYLEYQNVANPADAATVPSFQPQDRLGYYAALAGTPDRDYLRVPMLVTPLLSVRVGDEAFFPAGRGNQLTFSIQSAGTIGANGKPFADTVNSKLCGVALVCAPSIADRTQDLVYARSYYPAAKQQLKTPNGQFGVAYTLTFGLPGT